MDDSTAQVARITLQDEISNLEAVVTDMRKSVFGEAGRVEEMKSMPPATSRIDTLTMRVRAAVRDLREIKGQLEIL